MSTSFTPTATSQWRQESVGISSYASSTDFRFKFSFLSGGGNNIYIDDINIADPSSVNDLEEQTALNIFPNPVNGSSDISFQLISQQNVKLGLYDLLGRNVRDIFSGQLSAGDHLFSFDKGTLGAGIYFIKLDIGGNTISKKVVIE